MDVYQNVSVVSNNVTLLGFPAKKHIHISVVHRRALLDQLLVSLPAEHWVILSREFYILAGFARKTEDTSSVTSSDLSQFESLSSRVCSFVGQRLPLKLQPTLGAIIASDPSAEVPELQFALEAVVKSCLAGSPWAHALEMIRTLYLRGVSIPMNIHQGIDISTEVAEKISRELEQFPLPLVAAADSSLRANAGAKAEGLQSIASRDKWFR